MSDIRHKTVNVKTEPLEDEPGTFQALVSVFGNVDMVGDRMMKGAFARTLKNWDESGDPLPVVLSHDWDDPFSLIGRASATDMQETDEGLVVKARLDLSNPTAAQVYKLMKERLLKSFSFGYTVPAGGESKGKDGVNEVSDVDLIEIGPTLVGANPDAQLQAVKSALAVGDEVEDYLQQKISEDVQPPQAIEDAKDEEPETAKSQAQDSLRKVSLATALEVLSDGASLRHYEEVIPEPPVEPSTEDEQRRRFCDLTLP